MKRIVLLLLGACCVAASHGETTKHKKIDQVFSNVQNLKIESKYGMVQVKHWDKEDVRFEVLISIEGSNEQKNERIADNISVDFTEGDRQLIAQTMFGDFFSLKKLTNSLFNKGGIKIKYTVQVPSDVNLEIVQKNGDIFMDSHNGKVDIDLTNGSFTAQNLNGENKFKITDATFKATGLGVSEIKAVNSEVELGKASKLSGESWDSKYSIQAIDNLNIKSARDKFDIKEVEYLYGTSSFSKFEVEQLGGEVDFELRFGHINVFNVNYMFSFIKLDSRNGNIGLNFMDGCQIGYEINHKSVKFDNSPRFVLTNNETADKGTFVAKGKIGSENPVSKLNIKARNCKIRLN